ncbi:amidohydrolase [Candidatus Bipolaricaulota bacterium]|nr:amidohydrolase [Candidatus Bipolaricaulota bacterium]
MKKKNYYAPYYNEDFFEEIASTNKSDDLIETWAKHPTPGNTNNISVAEYTPQSNLELPRTELDDPPVEITDAHNHLDGYNPEVLLKMMDKAGIGKIMNLSGLRQKPELLAEQDRLNSVMGDRLMTAAPLPWHEVSKDGAVDKFCRWLEEYEENGVVALKIYKKLGLVTRDEYGNGELLELTDGRFNPVWKKCSKLNFPIFIHQADPEAFFHKIDKNNERLEELGAHRDWSWYDPEGELPSREELLRNLERVIASNPETIFVSVHVGNDVENLQNVSRMLGKYPNMWVDISARVAGLGRQPNLARKFFQKHPDRVIFGSDLPPHHEMYSRYRRFFETDDDNFKYPTHVSGQGNWRVSGISLSDEVVNKLYKKNMEKLLSIDHSKLISENRGQ